MTAGLAIFGDSWADPNHGHELYPELDQLAWPNLLGRPVANYAHAGSSLYASYRLFLDHYRDYEQIVFVVTSVGRLPLNQVTTRSGVTWAISNADTAQHFLRDRPQDWSTMMTQRLKAIFDYYLWLQDYDADTHAAHLMLEHVSRLRPDTLFIPAFNQGHVLRGCTSLADWIEPTIMGLRPDWMRSIKHHGGIPYREQRCCCHLTPEANQSIAQAVVQALAQGYWLNEPVPDRIEHEHDMGYYWDLSQKTGAFAT